MNGAGVPASPWWVQYLPLLIIAVAFAFRFKRMSRARPLRPKMMLVTPVGYAIIVIAMFIALPPSATGWLCFVGGLTLGVLLGWQRARLMRLHIDPDHGKVMVRQSPIVLVAILALVVARRLFMPHTITVGRDGEVPAQLLYLTDGGFGLALGMLGTQAILLWRRAKLLIAEHRTDG